MQKSVLIAAGGTGGHIFPAEALALELLEEGIEVFFMGAALSSNPYFNRTQWKFQDVSSATLSGKHFLKAPQNIYQLLKGVREAAAEVRKFDAVVGFGSYHALPPLVAAAYCKVPLVLHAADSIPGRVVRLMAPFASLVGVHFPEALSKLNRWGRVKAVEVPLPKKKIRGLRQEAFDYFGFSPTLSTLLIFGGSQGSQKINKAIPYLLQGQLKGWQVAHFTGPGEVDFLEEFYRSEGVRYVIKPFEKRIELAWSIADLYIGRSGANAVAEMVDYAVPGLLIPYPEAKDGHQEENARAVIGRIKGGVLLLQKDLERIEARASFTLLQNQKEQFRENLLSERQRERSSLCQHVIRVINDTTTTKTT